MITILVVNYKNLILMHLKKCCLKENGYTKQLLEDNFLIQYFIFIIYIKY